MTFVKVRKKAAELFDNIGKEHDEVASICTEASFLCNYIDYEGGDQILCDLLELADEMQIEPDLFEDEESVIEGFHDPICNYFYDNKVDMDKWDEYWQSAYKGCKS